MPPTPFCAGKSQAGMKYSKYGSSSDKIFIGYHFFSLCNIILGTSCITTGFWVERISKKLCVTSSILILFGEI